MKLKVFQNMGIKIWDLLPSQIKSRFSLSVFKRKKKEKESLKNVHASFVRHISKISVIFVFS